MKSTSDLVGLIPAGGQALRLGNLPCSKEIYPLQLWAEDPDEPRVVSENLVNYYKEAGCSSVYFILRDGKWDIPAYYGDGSEFGIPIAYLIMDLPYGTPFTLDQAYPYVKDKYIALGFPDMVIEPKSAIRNIYEHILKSDADVVLGLFPIENPEKWDMVSLGEDGKVKDIIIKRIDHDLKYGWSIAVWSPRFTKFLHDYVEKVRLNEKSTKTQTKKGIRETYVGDIILEAMSNDFKVESITFEKGSSIDIGTTDDLKNYIRKITKR